MDKLKPLTRLEDSLAKLPSVGRKSAERMAFAMLEMSDEDLNEFSEAVKNLKEDIHHCPVCGMLTNEDKCEICSNEARDNSLLMVVSYPKDVIAFEKIGAFDGVYHVLGGALSSVNGITIHDLNITSLFERIKEQKVEEIIVATPPNTEGETTALYLARVLENTGVNVTRIAYGLPLGGHLEYADALTLTKALEGRNKI